MALTPLAAATRLQRFRWRRGRLKETRRATMRHLRRAGASLPRRAPVPPDAQSGWVRVAAAFSMDRCARTVCRLADIASASRFRRGFDKASDGFVALTGGVRQAIGVDDLNNATAVADRPCGLQCACGLGHSRAAETQNAREKFLRDAQEVRASTVAHHEKRARKTGLGGMKRVADHRLLGQRGQRCEVVENDSTHGCAAIELPLEVSRREAVRGAANLHLASRMCLATTHASDEPECALTADEGGLHGVAAIGRVPTARAHRCAESRFLGRARRRRRSPIPPPRRLIFRRAARRTRASEGIAPRIRLPRSLGVFRRFAAKGLLISSC